MPGKKLDFEAVRKMAKTLPGIEDSTIHGAPSLKVRGKFLSCPALDPGAEENTLAIRIGFDTRAELLAADPDVYYLTDHYVNHPAVLVRLSRIHRDSLRDLLGMAWQYVTTKKSARKVTKKRGPRTTSR